MTAFHTDTFSSGLDDLTRDQQADHIQVLRVLARTGRFSVFEATDNPVIAKTITRLIYKKCKMVKVAGKRTETGVLLKTTDGEYPWTNCELTDAGRLLIKAKNENC